MLGLALGCVFAVLAHGLNIIWGVLKVVNVAHGDFIMMGAYLSFFANQFWGLNPLQSVVINAGFGIVLGYVFYYGMFHYELRNKSAITLQIEMSTLVSTFGLSLFISSLANLVLSPNFVGIHWNAGSVALGDIVLPLGSLYISFSALIIVFATWLFLKRTYLGRAIRAYSQDIDSVKLSGINPTTVASFATALGITLAFVGGGLLTAWLPVGINPLMGQLYVLFCFVIVVIGGPGKMWGSLVGGVIIGIALDVFQVLLPSSMATGLAFLVLIPILLFRPEGLLG